MFNIDTDINSINQKLKEGKTLKQIAEELSIGYSTIKSKLNEAGYKKVNGQYIIQNNSNVLLPASTSGEPSQIEPDIINDILLRLEAVEKIIGNNINGKKTIIINLPEAEEHVTSFAINDIILQQWKEFCSKNKGFKNKDLIAQAMIDFMDKYNSD